MRRTLEITTRAGCALDCTFCPQRKLLNNYQSEQRNLSLDDFLKVLQVVPKDVEIHFSGFAEPFFNPLAGAMMLAAKNVGHPVHVYTTLMGMTERQAFLMEQARPEYIRIHVPDTVALTVDSDVWIGRHELFYVTGLKASYMSMGEMPDPIKSHLGRLNINVERPDMISRAGNLGWQRKDRPITGKLTCEAERWHSNVLMPNGDVYGCCMDYGLEMKLGNLLKQEYAEIEEAARQWSADKNPPENSMCRRCEWAKPL